MSPLVSKAQARWMFKNHPEMARHWKNETPNFHALPERKIPARKKLPIPVRLKPR